MLRTTAAAGSVAAVSWFRAPVALGRTGSLLPPPVTPGDFSYLTQVETSFLQAAVSRLIPADDLGPGAKEAGVAFFIDQQLAGPFGRAESWYMQGPWKKGTEQQGYQLKLSPAQLYRAAIKDIDEYCQRTFGKNFSATDTADQDKVLHGLEKGDIELPGAPAKAFFTMLLQNTGEGFFADPVYGGNRAFAGWKLVGFPGPRYNYVNEIEQYGKPYAMPTVGLAGRSGLPPSRKG
ncbi:MAG: gluconate 2-dehydrogenase subunit 3 family protein [Casimicrobiaceae bacterium]